MLATMNMRTAMENSKAVNPTPTVTGVKVYTPFQSWTLARLARLVQLKQEYDADSKADPAVKKALARALYSTFLDCVAQGMAEEAKKVLQTEPEGS
jgi:hypothetical protein